MRCYLMKGGEIHSIEYLLDSSDEDLIEQAIAIFRERARQGIESVEVWSGRRFVYRLRADQIPSAKQGAGRQNPRPGR